MIFRGNEASSFWTLYTDVTTTIGWTVIHFLWQGLAIAAVTLLLLKLLRSRSAVVHYVVVCGGLCLMGVAPVVTFCTMFEISPVDLPSETIAVASSTVEAIEFTSVSATDALLTTSDEPFKKFRTASDIPISSESPSLTGLWAAVQRQLTDLAPWIAILWIIGVAMAAVRLFIGWKGLRKLRSEVSQTELPQVVACLSSIKRGLGVVHNVAVGVSEKVTNPLAIGWLRPLIVLPAKILDELSPDQIKAVLAHEMAHIKRGDFVVNALQCIIETMLFFHPSVWWISSKVREERENCCDDLAVKVVGSRKSYAEALLFLEESRSNQQQLVLGADGGNLVSRIRRLTRSNKIAHQRSSFAPVVFALCLCLIFLPGLIAISSVSAQQQEEEKDPMILNQDIAITAVDSGGKPLNDVTVHAGVWSGDGTVEGVTFPPNRFYKTDDEGKTNVELPHNYYIVRLWISRDGYVPMFTHWEERQILDGDTPPKTLSIKMVKGIKGGGVVVDKNGDPVAGARIELSGSRQETKNGVRFLGDYGTVETDEAGRWSFDNLSPDQTATFTVSIVHENFLPRKQSIKRAVLVKNTATLELSKGIKVTGKIVNSAGEVVDDGLVIWGDNPYVTPGSQETEIDDEGKFETVPLMDSKQRITVVAKGYEPTSRMVDISAGMDPVNFQLQPGKKLRIKITDENDVPLPRAYVMVRKWRNSRSLYSNIHPNVKPTGIPTRANGDGIFEWDWAPSDEVVWSFGMRGYLPSGDIPLSASDEIHVVKLKRKPSVSGTVRLADTGKPGRFVKVTPIIKWRKDAVGSRNDGAAVVANAKGEFSFEVTRGKSIYRLEFSKKGYRSVLSEPFDSDSLPESLNVELVKSNPSSGTLLDLNGDPVASAKVFLVDEFNSLHLREYKTMSRVPTDTTDSAGKFEFEKQVDPTTLVVIHEAGYAEWELPKAIEGAAAEASDVEIELLPWGSIKGRIAVNGKPVVNAQVNFEPISQRPLVFNQIHSSCSTNTDSNGEFRFRRVSTHPSSISVFKRVAGRPASHRITIPVKAVPSESLSVVKDLAHLVEIPISNNAFLEQADLENAICSFVKIDGWKERMPDNFFKANPQVDSYSEALEVLGKTLDIKTRFELSGSQHAVNGTIAKHGAIKAFVMEPGAYHVSIHVPARPGIPEADTPICTLLRQEFEVQAPAGSGQLPPVDIKFQAPITVGESVEGLEFELAGKTISFADYKGKILLLDFWNERSGKINATNRSLASLKSSLQVDDPLAVLSLHCAARPDSKQNRQFTDEMKNYVESFRLQYDGGIKICSRFGAWHAPLAVVIDQQGKIMCIDSHEKAVEVVRELLDKRE